MTSYDLLKLSAYEFELLSRDLLQRAFKVFIESFSEGRDSGIDLRFAYTKGKESVVQCKRFSTFASLYSTLKAEVEKVKRLDIARYYITTTVPLTPGAKDKVYRLFHPLIKNKKDILGREDINNLISQYKDVEQKYYKLWLSSSSVLKTLLHSKVFNTSKFDREELGEITKVYVQNESFDRAMRILESRHVLIISGIPGIGKTTLAKMLVYHLLSRGFQELVSLTDALDDAFSVFHESENQIFLYDDFLGRNFLDDKLRRNEDALLLRLMKVIESSNNKLLIMTTREYILRQAQESYELMGSPRIDLSKFLLDISLYTKLIRAQILYNHLFFSQIPSAYLQDMIIDNRYMQIVTHRNYNPRIIEAILATFDAPLAESGGFFKYFWSRFENPEDVWRHAFENQITPMSRITLLVMATTGTPLLNEDLRSAVEQYYALSRWSLERHPTAVDFSRSLRELEGSFITLEKDSVSHVAVDFLNPSIHDFLTNRILSDRDLSSDLLKGSRFLNQFFLLFDYRHQKSLERVGSKVALERKSIGEVADYVMDEFDKLEICSLHKVHYSRLPRFEWKRSDGSEMGKIFLCTNNFDLKAEPRLGIFLARRFDGLLRKNALGGEIGIASQAYGFLMEWVECSAEEVMSLLLDSVEWTSGLYGFDFLKNVVPDQYRSFVAQDWVQTRLKKVVEDDVDNVDDDWIDNLIEDLEMVRTDFGLDVSAQIARLESKRTGEMPGKLTSAFVGNSPSVPDSAPNEDELIRSMFASLRGRDVEANPR